MRLREKKKRYSEIKTNARLCETNQETNRKKHQGERRERASPRGMQGAKDAEREKKRGGKESFRKGGRRAQTLGRNQNSKGEKFLKQERESRRDAERTKEGNVRGRDRVTAAQKTTG